MFIVEGCYCTGRFDGLLIEGIKRVASILIFKYYQRLLFEHCVCSVFVIEGCRRTGRFDGLSIEEVCYQIVSRFEGLLVEVCSCM